MANALFGSFLLWDCTSTAAKKETKMCENAVKILAELLNIKLKSDAMKKDRLIR